MPYCPECGGEMRYVSATKHYVCKSCGLSLTHQELIEIRESRIRSDSEEDERKKTRKEYLEWWLSKKKK